MTLASESASMMWAVIVVLPEPVPPQMPMMSGRLSSGRMGSVLYLRLCELVVADFFLPCLPDFLSSITAWAAARRAIGTRKGDALT
jgi:hypothetical protein